MFLEASQEHARSYQIHSATTRFILATIHYIHNREGNQGIGHDIRLGPYATSPAEPLCPSSRLFPLTFASDIDAWECIRHSFQSTLTIQWSLTTAVGCLPGLASSRSEWPLTSHRWDVCRVSLSFYARSRFSGVRQRKLQRQTAQTHSTQMQASEI